MRTGRGFLAGLYFFEEPHERDAAEAEQSDPAEDIHKGPEQRLLANLVIDLCSARGHSIGGPHLPAEEPRNHP